MAARMPGRFESANSGHPILIEVKPLAMSVASLRADRRLQIAD